MIDKMTIKNFRGFRDLTLDGMRRINFLLGPNGAGKTAVMEALALAASQSSYAAVLLRRFRGLPPPNAPVLHLLTLFDDLFYRFDANQAIEITLEGKNKPKDKKFSRRLTIGRESTATVTIPLNTPAADFSAQSTDIFRSPVSFTWNHEAEDTPPDKFTETPQITQAGFQFASGTRHLPLIFIPARGFFDGATAAENFTRLARDNKEKNFINVMKSVFPDIEDISVAYEQNIGQLWVEAKGLARKASISLLSDGISHISQILLGIASNVGGIALIDEVENGIHFKSYGRAIKAIDEFAAEFKTQVFITTHNDEILEAFLHTRDAKDDDFSIIVCHRNDEGGTEARIASGEWAKLALKSGIELRV